MFRPARSVMECHSTNVSFRLVVWQLLGVVACHDESVFVVIFSVLKSFGILKEKKSNGS